MKKHCTIKSSKDIFGSLFIFAGFTIIALGFAFALFTATAIGEVNTQPTITLNGDNPTLFILDGVSVPDLSASAFDKEDGDISRSIQISAHHVSDETYILTYSVVDANNVPAVAVTRTVEVSSGNEVYLSEYLGLGKDNDSAEVEKLQTFLVDNEGATLAVTGVFDENTKSAVLAFQEKYREDILTPWGITEPTGYVYVTTKHKINDLYFDRDLPLNGEELLAMGIGSDETIVGRGPSMAINDTEDEEEGFAIGAGATLTGGNDGLTILKNGFGGIKGLDLAAIAVFPTGFENIYDALIDLLLILFIITIIWLIIRQVFFDEGSIGTKKFEKRRAIFFSLATLIAAIIGVVTGLQYVVVPLVAISIVLAGVAIFSGRNKNTASAVKKHQEIMKIK